MTRRDDTARTTTLVRHATATRDSRLATRDDE